MVGTGRGRQKIAIARIEKESNRQVTFSKRRFGIFKKACELCTLCDVEVCVIIYSPGHKVFSFGNPSVEYVIDKYLNQGHSYFLHPRSNIMQRERISQSHRQLYEVERQVTDEKNKKKELKKTREKNKKPQNWWEDPNYDELEEVELGEIKASLEMILREATNRIQNLQRPPNYYMGSSNNAAANGTGGGNNSIHGDLDMIHQRGPMDMYGQNNNQNMNPSNVMISPYVYNAYGDINAGLVPEYDMFIPEQNENQGPEFDEEGGPF